MKVMEIGHGDTAEEEDEDWAIESFEREEGDTFDFPEDSAVPNDEGFMFEPDEFF
jgi:hypothetical protein